MSRRLFFTRNRPANVDNHYVVGSGVGSKSRFVRSALRRRSSNNAHGKPCCFPMPKTRDDISATVEEKNNCTGGMVWKECGSACTRTCSEPEPVCTKQCVPKCECPEGHVLEGGQCVDVNICGPTDVSCGELSGNYIKDNSGIETKYCCTKWDGSGCTSNSQDDVCLDKTSDNSGNDVCLSVKDRFSNCSSVKPPSPPPPSDIPNWISDCVNCADINSERTKLLVNNYASGEPWEKGKSNTWNKIAEKYYGCKDPEICYFSALDAAKMWILGTDDITNTTLQDEAAMGGCNSCVATTAVAIVEGGNQVAPADVGDISKPDSYPRNMWDPTFSTKMCNNDEKCTNGGIWQVSSAWISGTNPLKCCDCEKADCFSLENPLCAAKISMWHAIGTSYNKQTSMCDDSTPKDLTCPSDITNQCSIDDMQKGIDPNCYFGPFGLCSAGWNTPTCNHLYRRAATGIGQFITEAWQKTFHTAGRIAIDACRQAKIELEAAGWKSKNGSCNVENSFVNELEKDHTTGLGDWTIPDTDPCMCGKKKCYSPEP